jgi:serine phosphatase RsbU (regulator of sigma subunit)
MMLAVIDTTTGGIRAAGGGNEPALVLRASGEAEEIAAGGIVLGVDADWVFEEVALRLGEEDLLLLVTDGVTEARCGGAVFFGYEGFTEAARRAVASVSGSLDDIGDAIIRDARDFAGGRLQDDACLLLVRRWP